jgi:hypothetical protein
MLELYKIDPPVTTKLQSSISRPEPARIVGGSYAYREAEASLRGKLDVGSPIFKEYDINPKSYILKEFLGRPTSPSFYCIWKLLKVEGVGHCDLEFVLFLKLFIEAHGLRGLAVVLAVGKPPKKLNRKRPVSLDEVMEGITRALYAIGYSEYKCERPYDCLCKLDMDRVK